MLAGVACGNDHPLDAAVAEAAGHNQPVAAGEKLRRGVVRHGFTVDPSDIHPGAAGVARVAQRLRHREVGVVQLDVFAHKPDGDAAAERPDAGDQFLPFSQFGRARPEAELPADDQGKVMILQHQRGFVQIRQSDVLNHAVGHDVAEHGDFAEDFRFQRLIAAQHDDVRRNSHPLQFFHRVLRGFGLVLVAPPQKGNQSDVNKAGVLPARLQADLPCGLQKRLAFNVAGGAADFRNDDVGPGFLADAVNKVLDFLRDMRDDLHGLAEVLAPPLLVQHVPVHLAGSQVGIPVQILVNKALIVAEVEVRLASVLGDVDLAVLVRAHGTRVHIDVRVKLLRGHLQPAALEQPAQRSGGDSLAESRYHAAGHKHIFRHTDPSREVMKKKAKKAFSDALRGHEAPGTKEHFSKKKHIQYTRNIPPGAGTCQGAGRVWYSGNHAKSIRKMYDKRSGIRGKASLPAEYTRPPEPDKSACPCAPPQCSPAHSR